MTFANGRQQELQLLVTKLHPSAPIILGFSWLCSTNPHVNWPNLTLCLDWDNPTNSELVPFDVSPSSENSKTMIDHSWTPLELHSRYSPPSLTAAPLVPSSAVDLTSNATTLTNSLSSNYSMGAPPQ
ncbi:hypothetical protein E4T56_gene9795 [Termitomyces sp. T112]|nr:hypothetical protein E4T56_gene9795 [Termitomyces sp. T112]